MLGDRDDLCLIVRKANEECPIPSVYSKRVDQSMSWFRKFRVQGRMGGIVFEESFRLFPFFCEATAFNIPLDVVSKIKDGWHEVYL